jgi:predicted nucleic acid-binding protein
MMEKLVIDGINKRLDAHGVEIDNIEKCIERLTVISENVNRTESDHEQRLRALEGHSGALWDKVIVTALSAVVSGVVAFAMVQLGM